MHVAQRVHRLPESAVLERLQLAIRRQPHERVRFPAGLAVHDIVQNFWRQHEKTPVYPAAIALRLLDKLSYEIAFDPEAAVATRRLHRRHRCRRAVAAMKFQESADIDVCDTVAIGKAEQFFLPDMLRNSLKPATRIRVIASVDQRHPPRLNQPLMHLNL